MKNIFLLGITLILQAVIISCQNQAETESFQTVVMQLLPGDNNPRNSEGDFITLKDGRILFIYSHYTGTSNDDHAPAYLAGRFSSDGGKTWSNEDVTVVEKEGDMNVMSVSLLRLQNGHIALFYLRKNSEEDCIPMMRISTDEAKTWGSPTACITDREGYFVLNNNRVIQLKNGRLLMAVALHKTPGDSVWNGKGKIYSYYSDDNGVKWRSGEEVQNPSGIVSQEPGVVELKDGTIMMYIRASGGFQQLSLSKDNGQTWSPMVAGNMPSPISPASISRIPSTGDLLLVWNNNDGSNQQTAGKRTPLTVAVSKDEGKSWEHIRDVETDPNGWYCYMAIHFTKNDVLLSYCTGPPQHRHLTVTNVMQIRQKDLYQKKIANGYDEKKLDEAGHRIFYKAEPLNFLKRSAGPFMQLADGSIFSIQAEKRETTCFISKDNGVTWAEYPLFDPEKFAVVNPVFVWTRKGTIIVCFSNLKELSPLNWDKTTHCYAPEAKIPTYIIYSKDSGKTWSQPQKLHDEWTGYNRAMIETKDGHIVLSTMKMRNNPGRHCVLTYVSSDDGMTWTPSNILDNPSSAGDHSGLMEANIIQLKDGRIWMLIRTNWDYFYESYSSDNGLTWSAINKTNIDASSAPCALLRLHDGRILIVWNRLYHKGRNEINRVGGDKNFTDEMTSWQRDELSLMLSDDEGKTWTEPVIIAENTKRPGNLSYPYLFQQKKGVVWITTMYGNLKIAVNAEDLTK